MNYRDIKKRLNLIQEEIRIQDIPRIITFKESEEQNNVWIITEQYYNKYFKCIKKEMHTEDYQNYLEKY